MKKVSCIIPAYNEGERIGRVLEAAVGHHLIEEIIVIDDGSSDNTKDIVKGFGGVTFIEHGTNKGKSAAVHAGIMKSKGELLLFLDADLIGLTASHITQLIEPVLSGKADASISLRGNKPKLWQRIGLDYISGERVFRKELIKDHVHKIPELRGFGLKVFLNRIKIKNKSSLKVV